MGSLAEYLKTEVEQLRAEMTRRQENLEEWNTAIHRLYDQLEAWLKEADNGLGPHEAAGVAGRQIVLSHVEAGFEQEGEIGAIVDDEAGAGFAAKARHGNGRGKDVTRPVAFVADLQDGGAAIEKSGGGGFEKNAAGGQSFGIQDRVDPGQSHAENGPS